MRRGTVGSTVIVASLALAVPAGAKSVDVKDSGKTVHLDKGEVLKVTLIDNIDPDKGWSWVDNGPPDPTVLRRGKVKGDGMSGASKFNEITWNYRARDRGRTRLLLLKKTPNDKVLRRFKLTVVVG